MSIAAAIKGRRGRISHYGYALGTPVPQAHARLSGESVEVPAGLSYAQIAEMVREEAVAIRGSYCRD